MKAKYFNSVTRALLFVYVLLTGADMGAQVTYSFTTCGASGANGPIQSQVNAAYVSGTLTNSVVVTGGIQSFTVPTTGAYLIDMNSASGGSPANYPTKFGGYGVNIKGEFNLTAGDVLKILVGQKGTDGTGGSGGGGGTYVTCNNVLLIAAGGGGGATSDNNAANGSVLTIGTNDFPGGSTPGGTGGAGGQACNVAGGGANHGGGGGGYSGNGATSTAPTPGIGGLSFINGGTGGAGTGIGGFGGGGGATSITVGGGGGGGYSGGAGGQQVNYCTPGIGRSGGGGGGSYNSGTNQQSSTLNAYGDGKVTMSFLCNISLTTPVNPICIGSQIALSTNAVSGISWSAGGTATSITVSPTVSTTYTVTGTSSTSCTYYGVLTVTVNPLPVIVPVTTPSLLCVGNTATISGTGANTYTWSNGNSGLTTTLNPVVSTVYNVTATSVFGCVNSKTFAVNVNANSLTTTPSTNLCKGSAITLTASGANTYTWSNGYMFSSTPVSPSVSTVYTISGTDASFCKLSKVISITVVDPPSVTISANKSIICKGEAVTLTGGGASTYTWNSGFAGVSVTYTLPVDIDYHYSVSGADASTGCTKTSSITISVAKCTGISESRDSEAGINLSPNPSQGLFNVNFSALKGDCMLEVFNELGMKVFSQKLISAESSIDLRKEKPGIYFVRISQHEHVIKVAKLVKE